MKTFNGPPPRPECFTFRQYSDKHLTALYDALMVNRRSKVNGSYESGRLNMAKEEMKRRGIKP